MSFVMSGLGPGDQGSITTLSPIIITTLRNISSNILRGGGKNESAKWFGDSAGPWMQRLGQNLNKMATVVNTKDINISFRDLDHRKGSFAAASAPASGWGTYTSVADAQGQNFVIRLDTAWNKAPLYSPPGAPGDSMFQTLVHEITHLLLDTNDHAYGVASSLQLAKSSPYKAKDNADNWGYFVEEFR
jgi:hypothetical protein